MVNVFIFHGNAGYPEENWFPWLKEQLESLGCDVIVPQFPTPENQNPEHWFEVLREYQYQLTSDTILIGHSLGGAFLLRVLERYDIKIRAAYLVAAPVGVLPLKNYETDKPFIIQPFDWEKIKAHARAFSVFQSDDDPYVCLGNGEELARKLGVNLTFVPNAGHFNAAAGYLQFPLLLEKIRENV